MLSSYMAGNRTGALRLEVGHFDNDSCKDSIKLLLILHPLPTDHRHAHCPNSPIQQRHPPQFNLGAPPASSQHTCSCLKGLNHVEIGPADMIGYYDGGFSFRKRVA